MTKEFEVQIVVCEKGQLVPAIHEVIQHKCDEDTIHGNMKGVIEFAKGYLKGCETKQTTVPIPKIKQEDELPK